MLCRAAGQTHLAAEATLQAAWALDDADDPDAARLRRAAAAEWGAPDSPESALRLIDVLRRAGEFGSAAAVEPPGMDENSARILAFQRDRIAARDTGRHLISAALRPPARTPHVTHGRRSEGGFWRRIFGG